MTYHPKEANNFFAYQCSPKFSEMFSEILQTCKEINKTNGLTYCIKTTKKILDDLDTMTTDKLKNELPLYQKIIKLSLQTYGIRAMYSGFLLLAGESLNSDFQMKVHNMMEKEDREKVRKIVYGDA